MPSARRKPAPRPLIEAILEAVADAGWTAHDPSDSDASWVVKMPFDGESSSYEVEIRATDPIISCFVAFPMCVPSSRISAVAEYITRANWELRVGNFDLDWEGGGHLQFRTGINVGDGRPTNRMIQSLVRDGVETADRFHDGAMQVAFGNRDPARAFNRAWFGDEDEGDE